MPVRGPRRTDGMVSVLLPSFANIAPKPQNSVSYDELMGILRLPNHRVLTLDGPPLIMGILNATPDSFFAESRIDDPEEAAERGLSMVESGAAILDVGGESSRPGSDYVSDAQELERIVPVIRAIRRQSDIPLSVDTRKAVVAEASLDAGADIVNDISALRDDPALAGLCAERNVPTILMHMKGTPKTMQKDPYYDDPVSEIRAELAEYVASAERAGVEQIVVDPGIGFGKRLKDNLAILAHLKETCDVGRPILVGLSRKSFLGMILRDSHGKIRPTEGRLTASLAAHAMAIIAGAQILRVHDVAETADLIRVVTAIRTETVPGEAAWTG